MVEKLLNLGMLKNKLRMLAHWKRTERTDRMKIKITWYWKHESGRLTKVGNASYYSEETAVTQLIDLSNMGYYCTVERVPANQPVILAEA